MIRHRRREEEKPKLEERSLDVNASMQGTLRFEESVNLKINGKFEGMLDTKGTLTIGDKAFLNANICGEDITVAGVVNGNVKAHVILRLESTAKLNGDVDTPRILVKEGAVINGAIRMGGSMRQAAVPRGDWMSVAQLAKYIEVDSGKVSEWVNNGVVPATREGGEWFFDKEKIDKWISEGKVRA